MLISTPNAKEIIHTSSHDYKLKQEPEAELEVSTLKCQSKKYDVPKSLQIACPV